MSSYTRLVKNDGSLTSRFFTHEDVDFEIIGTRSKGNRAIECEDLVKNLKTNKSKWVARHKLKKFYKK